MNVFLECECGNKDFEISEWGKYAKCKKCGENIYIKDAEFNFDYEEEKTDIYTLLKPYRELNAKYNLSLLELKKTYEENDILKEKLRIITENADHVCFGELPY